MTIINAPILHSLNIYFTISIFRLAVGETVNKLAGHNTEDVVEYIEEKELKANTQMLEIIG